MARVKVRFFLFYVSLCPAVFAAGQMERLERQVFDSDLKAKVIDKMRERNDRVRQFRWSDRNDVFQKPLAIKYCPKEDFNVYFTISHLVTPGIKASMEVSLNNPGTINLRHRIALRKKDRE